MGIYNRYANMKIARPDENIYPKWIDHDGISSLVHDSDEEAQVKQKTFMENPPGFGESLGTKEEYKAKLMQECIDMGIPARKAWGIPKLQKALHDHGQ